MKNFGMRMGVIAGVLLCAMAAGCSRDDRPTVVLYASADDAVVREVVKAFEAAHKVRVLVVGDTEAQKTTGLVERIKAEKDRPQADVFWSSEVFMTIALADQGLLDEYLSDSTVNWPTPWRDGQRRWFGFAARARVIVYSTERVSAERIPQTWMDLTQAKYRDRVVMADPRYGTTGGHLGAMQVYWTREVGPGYYEAFLEGLAENHIRVLSSGNAGVVDAVVRGEADVGMTDTDDVWAAKARGLKIECVYPRHHVDPNETGCGTLIIPNTAAIVKGGPHPKEAKELMEFLLSEDTERMLAKSESHNIPVQEQVAKDFPQLAVADPLQVDYVKVAAVRDEAVNKAVKRLMNDQPGQQVSNESERGESFTPEVYSGHSAESQPTSGSDHAP
ncbi:MAG TPA: extracellular solute-binding protein [Phycisphaerales bacterium]|nr:extracellular solute-binding protein [Phycisphaerales bacterium]